MPTMSSCLPPPDAVSPGVPVRLEGDVGIIGNEVQPSLAAINDRVQDSQVVTFQIAMRARTLERK